MSLRNLSNFSSSMPSQPTAGPMSLGGGKGMAGSQRPQANPQSQMLQQLMQMMMARRQGGMQNPGFMSPLQRMGGVMPQLPSQAAPQAVQAVQGNTPGMQAQQAAAVAQAQQEAQRAAQTAAPAADPNAGKTPYDLTGFNQYIGNGQWVDNYGNPVSLAPNQIGYREPRTPTLPFLPR